MDIRQELTRVAEDSIEKKVFPGCVIGIVRKNGDREILQFGNFTYEESSPKVAPDTLYDVASVTKAVVTASLALQLIDEGKLRLLDKLIQYVPEFNNSDREHVLIQHLLTYTLDARGFRSANRDEFLDPEKHKHFIFTEEFAHHPGEVFTYANVPMFLLGLVIENITGSTLDALAQKRFFDPLSMRHSTFYPEKFPIESIPPTEIDDWRGEVRGVVHDESSYVFKTVAHKVVGHAGLFSTAPDLLSFLEMLLHEGRFNGITYFSQDMIEQMQTNQLTRMGESMGLGWELHEPSIMGDFCTEKTIGKTGFTGTVVVADIKQGVAYTMLSNRTYPKRPQDSESINAVRRAIGTIILSPTSF